MYLGTEDHTRLNDAIIYELFYDSSHSAELSKKPKCSFNGVDTTQIQYVYDSNITTKNTSISIL